MDKNTGKFLAEQLYPDLKNWIPSLWRLAKTPIAKWRAPKFNSISDLLNALKTNQIKPDSWVALQCKPSMFGPFLRNHFMVPFIGHNTRMRLGPPLVSENPVLAMMGQVTSHLKPVGMYPPISDDLFQICLYPADATVCGMVGLMPGVNNLVEYLPAVSNGKNLSFCGMSCNVRGVVRQIDPKLLTDIGIPVERYEELRQSGDIWFLDLSADTSEVEPHAEAVTTEMWGGLYASGHIEILGGELKIEPLIEGMVESMRKVGFEPYVNQNKAARKEVTVYAQGIRAIIDIQSPVYSIHMDSEIALQYKDNTRKFDTVCKGYLGAIKKVARSCGVDIANPDDLDFSYTNSEKSYTVLKSLGADHIADPVGVVIRDWHRKRGK